MNKPKFVGGNDEKLHTLHYDYCQKHHLPFILIKHKGKDICEIFYDVTELPVNLENTSNEVKQLFMAYKKFFLLDDYFGQNYMDNHYFLLLSY